MARLLVMLVALMEGHGAFGTSNLTLPALLGRRPQLERQLQTTANGMPTWKPDCPLGYLDQTHGAAYFWKCGENCPGKFPWADAHCGCACVLPGVYWQIEAKRAEEAATPAPAAAATLAPGLFGTEAPSIADTAPAEGTFVAPPDTPTALPVAPIAVAPAGGVGIASPAPPPPAPSSLGGMPSSGSPPPAAGPASPAPADRTQVADQVVQQAGTGEQGTLQPSWQTWQESLTTAAPALGDTRQGLPDMAVALISIGTVTLFTWCLLVIAVCVKIRNMPSDKQVENEPMLVRLLMRLIGVGDTPARKRHKTSRVAPISEEATSTALEVKSPNLRSIELPDPVQFCVPPTQRYVEHKVQPPADFPPMDFIKVARCPDISIISRQQKERVMNGGWTAGMNAPPRRMPPSPSLPQHSARSVMKPSPPASITSNTSTRSPSLPRSSASTRSKKSSTTPSLDGH